MSERCWEINGNLYGECGLKNVQDFEEVIIKVKNLYDRIFGKDAMNEYDLYIDNATENSGYVPIITIILSKYIIIKLGIYENDSKGKIALQFAHELTHYVFYSYFGLPYPITWTSSKEYILSALLLLVFLSIV